MIKGVTREFGLEINEGKTKTLVYGVGGGVKVGNVAGIQVVDRLTYLGLEVVDGRDIFKIQKEEVLKKTESRAFKTTL